MNIQEYKKVFLTRKNGVKAAKALYDYYIDLPQNPPVFVKSKALLAQELNVSARTIANYIITLKELGLIKRKYDGKTVLNPDYFFSGSSEALKEQKRIYADFTSDEIKKQKEGN